MPAKFNTLSLTSRKGKNTNFYLMADGFAKQTTKRIFHR